MTLSVIEMNCDSGVMCRFSCERKLSFPLHSSSSFGACTMTSFQRKNLFGFRFEFTKAKPRSTSLNVRRIRIDHHAVSRASLRLGRISFMWMLSTTRTPCAVPDWKLTNRPATMASLTWAAQGKFSRSHGCVWMNR